MYDDREVVATLCQRATTVSVLTACPRKLLSKYAWQVF